MRVQLFATCLGDLVFPDAVADAAALLRAAGCDVEFPAGQTCCGQPAFNAGHRRAADRLARQFARAFDADTPIVCPSGSCASMVAHRMPVSYRVWELSAFLDHVGATPTARNDGVRVAYHSSCHLLRELGVDEAPRRLLAQTGAEVVPLIPGTTFNDELRKIPPHLVLDPPDDAVIMQEEIFGPLLPVRTPLHAGRDVPGSHCVQP